MRFQHPSVTVLETVVRIFRQKWKAVNAAVHAGSSTNLKMNRLKTSMLTGKMHLVGHESCQCNFNGYVETWCNPSILPENPNVVVLNFMNQAFRVNDNTFGRIFYLLARSPEEALKVHAVLMLGVAAAKEKKLRRNGKSNGKGCYG